MQAMTADGQATAKPAAWPALAWACPKWGTMKNLATRAFWDFSEFFLIQYFFTSGTFYLGLCFYTLNDSA